MIRKIIIGVLVLAAVGMFGLLLWTRDTPENGGGCWCYEYRWAWQVAVLNGSFTAVIYPRVFDGHEPSNVCNMLREFGGPRGIDLGELYMTWFESLGFRLNHVAGIWALSAPLWFPFALVSRLPHHRLHPRSASPLPPPQTRPVRDVRV